MNKSMQDTKKHRLNKAKNFLFNNSHPKDLIKWYSRKFKVTKDVAELELYEIGFGEYLQIEYFKSMNIDWKYQYDPLSDELIPVSEDTPEW